MWSATRPLGRVVSCETTNVQRYIVTVVCGFFVAVGVGMACGDDGLSNAGEPCDHADQCYERLGDDRDELRGEPLCLGDVPGGYCTHLCESDADCCAVDGECEDGLPQVCAPFQSTGMMMCFLSCERAATGDHEEGAYCREFAHRDFGCRSTGGGSQNRKVCVP
jgi:hypothetical protein